MANEITTSSITVNSLNAYLARPERDDGRGMLLLPMVTGIGEQVREFAADIAGAGVTVLSWDPWHGPSTDDTSREELMAMLGKLDDETALAEQTQLLDYMFTELGLRSVGVIGYCLGGRFAFLLAGQDRRLANVIAYHPTVPTALAPNQTVDPMERAAAIEAPVMVLYPAEDHLAPWEAFTQLQAALQRRATGASLIHVYPGAEHGFSDRVRHGNEVNKDAYAVSWPQALEFIKTTTS